MGTGIVVGLEGTPAGRAAVEWAFREGLVRGATVRVVHAWTHAGGHDIEAARAYQLARGVSGSSSGASRANSRSRSSCMVVAAVAEAQRAVGARPSVVERSRAGYAARVLLEEAEDADLLVIGRGHRAGVVDVLGHSVSAEMVRHAKCPVVIVPRLPGAAEPVDLLDPAAVVGATLD